MMRRSSDPKSDSRTDSSEQDEEKCQISRQKEDNKFSSTFSTYLTLLGYSIGLSDIWRFPFLAYRNGGGIFIHLSIKSSWFPLT